MSDTGFPPAVHDQIEGRSGGICEICGLDRVHEHHHRRPRGAGGTRRGDTNTASNGLGLCRDCHRFTESYRRLATLLGWLVPQSCDPATYPVIYRGEKVLLADDGRIEAAA